MWSFRVVLSPHLREIKTTILDVFIELVVVLAIPDELITGPVHDHEGIEGGSPQTGDFVNQVPIEPVAYIFILLLFDQATLQSQHLTILTGIKEHIQIEPHSPIRGAHQ